MLRIQAVSKRGEGNFQLQAITFSQREGERIAVSGETGAGKSTLLRLIAGLLQPDQGEIVLDGKKVEGPDNKLVPGHPEIAYLSQHFELQKSLRVEQVLAYANSLSGREAASLYAVCQIDHLLSRRTDQLSGGEKQRVAICRLLITSPRLLLLDEPFSHLDMAHKQTLKEVIRDIGDQLKITCMLVSHDPLDTLSWADKILVLKEGRAVQMDVPQVIYQQPVDEYTGSLFGKYNIISRQTLKPFLKLNGVKKKLAESPSQKLFVRPEFFRLGRKSAEAIRGKVIRTLFFGSHRETHVQVSQHEVIVSPAPANIKVGETVYLRVIQKGLWPLTGG